MSPYSCPDLICDIDAEDTFVSLEYKQNDKDKYTADVINPMNLNLNISLKHCNCSECRHSYTRIGIKKSIKWYSKQASYAYKQAKHLKDKGIKPLLSGQNDDENSLAFYLDTYNYYMYCCQEMRNIKKESKK